MAVNNRRAEGIPETISAPAHYGALGYSSPRARLLRNAAELWTVKGLYEFAQRPPGIRPRASSSPIRGFDRAPARPAGKGAGVIAAGRNASLVAARCPQRAAARAFTDGFFARPTPAFVAVPAEQTSRPTGSGVDEPSRAAAARLLRRESRIAQVQVDRGITVSKAGRPAVIARDGWQSSRRR